MTSKTTEAYNTLAENSSGEETGSITLGHNSPTLHTDTPSNDNLTTTTASTTLSAIASNVTADLPQNAPPIHHPLPTPRVNNSHISRTYAQISSRYSFSFSADLIAQFDKYRAQMRATLEKEFDETDEDNEPGNISRPLSNNISDQQRNYRINRHSPPNSLSSNPEFISKTRDLNRPPSPSKSCFPGHTKSKSLGSFSFLRGKSKTEQEKIGSGSLPGRDEDDNSLDWSNVGDRGMSEKKQKPRPSFMRRLAFFGQCYE